jgi:hypothetical protein
MYLSGLPAARQNNLNLLDLYFTAKLSNANRKSDQNA